MSSSVKSAQPLKRLSTSRAKTLPARSSQAISNLAHWKLEDAKARFSEVVRLAATDGPQLVTVRGKEAAIVLDPETYRRLLPAAQPEEQSLTDFLATLDFSGIDLEREPDYGRDIDFLAEIEGPQ